MYLIRLIWLIYKRYTAAIFPKAIDPKIKFSSGEKRCWQEIVNWFRLDDRSLRCIE